MWILWGTVVKKWGYLNEIGHGQRRGIFDWFGGPHMPADPGASGWPSKV